jgi:hypothetical protein
VAHDALHDSLGMTSGLCTGHTGEDVTSTLTVADGPRFISVVPVVSHTRLATHASVAAASAL